MPSGPLVPIPAFTDDNPFPPLPPILSRDIRTQVFTHRSFYARPAHVFEDHPHDPSPDNEKFEHLGDTVLGFVVTNLLLDTYPNLHVGPSTKIRALIVGNPTLAAISRRYGLPERLKLHPVQAISLRASLHIQADVFESYVGGLYRDQGLPTVERWLRALFTPYTTEAYMHVRAQHGLPPPPSPSLASTASVSSSSSASLPRSSPSSPSSSPPTSPSRPSRAAACPPRRHPLYPHASSTAATSGHLALFNQHLQKDKREVEWIYDDHPSHGTTSTPIWVVHVEVDGKVLGSGRGSTKKAARNEAAKEGLAHMGIVV